MRNDAEILADLHAAIDPKPALAHADIVIEVRDGIVALGGHVSSYAAKLEVQAAAQGVPGVRVIANDIDVRPGLPKMSDREIADAASRALRSNVSIPASAITAIVKDGWIALEGTVSIWFQKDAAETTVSSLWGVKGVTNNIAVVPAARATLQ